MLTGQGRDRYIQHHSAYLILKTSQDTLPVQHSRSAGTFSQGIGGCTFRAAFRSVGPSVHWNDGPSAAGRALEMAPSGDGCHVLLQRGEKFYGYDRLWQLLICDISKLRYVKGSPDIPQLIGTRQVGRSLVIQAGFHCVHWYPLHSRIPRKLWF